jgi:hypothetical protein
MGQFTPFKMSRQHLRRGKARQCHTIGKCMEKKRRGEEKKNEASFVKYPLKNIFFL